MDLPSKNYLIFFKTTREKNEFHTTEIRSSFIILTPTKRLLHNVWSAGGFNYFGSIPSLIESSQFLLIYSQQPFFFGRRIQHDTSNNYLYNKNRSFVFPYFHSLKKSYF